MIELESYGQEGPADGFAVKVARKVVLAGVISGSVRVDDPKRVLFLNDIHRQAAVCGTAALDFVDAIGLKDERRPLRAPGGIGVDGRIELLRTRGDSTCCERYGEHEKRFHATAFLLCLLQLRPSRERSQMTTQWGIGLPETRHPRRHVASRRAKCSILIEAAAAVAVPERGRSS